jgi:signal transduction histidine kinase/uncharacterized protein HemY
LTALLLALVCSGIAAAQTGTEALREELQEAEGAERVRILNELARATRGDATHESIAFAREALEVSRQIRDRQGEVESLNNIGIGHYYLAEYDLALKQYNASLRLAEEIEDDNGIASALNNIGIIYYVWGDYNGSLEHYSRVLEIRKRIGGRMETAKAYNNLGTVSYAIGRYEEALEYFFESLAIYEELDDKKLVASSLSNIGEAYSKLERLDEALDALERALLIEEGIDDKAGLALVLNNLGMVYGARDRLEEALRHYRRSLALREEIDDRQGAAVCELNIGEIYARTGRFHDALTFLDRALDIATEIGVKEVQRDAYLGQSRTYELMGDHAGAMASYKLFKEVNDSLFDEQTSRRLAEMQARYEVEKKDREIEVLRKNEEIQRIVRNVSLVGAVLLLVFILLLYNRYRLKIRANREREKAHRAELAQVSRVATLGELATALAHELNQPLTAILANAQATRRLISSDRGDPAELDETLADIAEGAGRASEIIQRLRKLIRRGDIVTESLDINEVLRDVQTFARADTRRRRVGLTMKLTPDLPRVGGDRIQLQQVLLNLVQNGAEAMKEGDEADRVLRVTTSMHDSTGVLVAVRDRGPVLDEESISRIFEPFYTTKEKGLGMGLTICRTIIEAHGGRLWASANPDRGLTVQFTLPRE